MVPKSRVSKHHGYGHTRVLLTDAQLSTKYAYNNAGRTFYTVSQKSHLQRTEYKVCVLVYKCLRENKEIQPKMFSYFRTNLVELTPFDNS